MLVLFKNMLVFVYFCSVVIDGIGTTLNIGSYMICRAREGKVHQLVQSSKLFRELSESVEDQ